MMEDDDLPALIPIDLDQHPKLAAKLERAMRQMADAIRAAWREAGE